MSVYLVIVVGNKLKWTSVHNIETVFQKLNLLTYAISCVINCQMVSTKLAYILHLFISVGLTCRPIV